MNTAKSAVEEIDQFIEWIEQQLTDMREEVDAAKRGFPLRGGMIKIQAAYIGVLARDIARLAEEAE